MVCATIDAVSRLIVVLLLLGVTGCGSVQQAELITQQELMGCDPGTCGGDSKCVNRVCVPNFVDEDGDGFAETSDCNDQDATVGTRAERSCESDCATGLQQCAQGLWSDCDAPTDCSCSGSETRTLSCPMCGQSTQDCQDGSWVTTEECSGQGTCAPGEIENLGSCGDCGTLRRICSDTCTWDSPACSNEGICTPTATETEQQSCGACGQVQERTRSCNSSCEWNAWGNWGSCGTGTACTPGQTQTENRSCGDCNTGTQTRTRTCSSECVWQAWSNWGGCTGETAACSPGQTETQTQTCNTTGSQQRTRTCSSSTCTWGSWSAWSTCSSCSVSCDPMNDLPETCAGQTLESLHGCPPGQTRSCNCINNHGSGSWLCGVCVSGCGGAC